MTATQAPEAAPGGAVKVIVTQEGAYELTAADLIAINPAWKSAEPGKFQLFHREQPVPLWVDGQESDYRLRFYGQAGESRYTLETIYVLKYAPDASQPLSSSVLSLSPAEDGAPARVTTRFEENKLYAPQVEQGDHFFWQSLPAPQSQTYELTLSQVAPGPTRLQVELWASTKAPVDPDHHLQLSVNGRLALEESWDGAGRRTLTADLPDGWLTSGQNQITLAAPGDTDASAEIVFVDWIAASYPTMGKPDGDALIFDGGDTPVSLAPGFSLPLTIWDISPPGDAVNVSPSRTAAYAEIPAGIEVVAGHRYLAVGANGYLHPTLRPMVSAPDLQSTAEAAEWIAVGPADLIGVLQPLIDQRAAQGLRPLTVPVEAIYDQFGGGYPEPEAVQAFLRFAAQNWPSAPRFLLLVGDATYDPRGYVAAPAANRLATFFVFTNFGGETVSDAPFGFLDTDGLPDLAIGRVPAQNMEQAANWVAKTLRYEQNAFPGDWQRRLLAVADGQEISFRSDAEAFLENFPAETYPRELYTPEAGTSDAAAHLQAYLDEGYFLLAYFGHGSINMWGKDRLFTAEDAAGLNNDRLPVVINMNCLTGFFTHPKSASLAEALLFQPSGGAAAVLAPTSLTLPPDQALLSGAFAQALVLEPTHPIGELLLQAQRQMPVDLSGAQEVTLTFLLFGDPAMMLVTP